MGEKFQVSPSTGTASLSVPLPLPSGRAGFAPALALSYDSGSGNGPFGLGWSLSAPAITCKTEKGIPRHSECMLAPDTYILSGAEDLVPGEEATSSGFVVRRYRPRVEGLFARIERWRAIDSGEIFWRSISKDNVTTLYGKTPNSRVADPEDPARILAWLICESFDDRGNAVTYQYKAEDLAGIPHSASEKPRLREAERRMAQGKNPFSQHYLQRIRYGNRVPQSPTSAPWELDSAGWCFEVVLDYGERGPLSATPPSIAETAPWPARLDAFSSCRAGFEIRTWRLCRQVLVFHHFPELGPGATPVRAIDLTYRETPVASYLQAVTVHGYRRRADLTWVRQSLPPLEFSYSTAEMDETVHEAAAGELQNLPAGLAESSGAQFVDLDGEGLNGVLSQHAGGWVFHRNLSPLNTHREDGREVTTPQFAPMESVAQLPSLAVHGPHRFFDLAGDGRLDVAIFTLPTPGFYERSDDEGWLPFRSFESLPNIAWDNPHIRFADLTGDGLLDLLITEDEVLKWHPSLGERGYGPAILCRLPRDEARGPAVLFASPEQAIYLADMSGDGLSDLVRIRHDGICYWPNLGYGRFGAQVTMDQAPDFDEKAQFSPDRLRLVDIDGSGTTDLIYLGRHGVTVYFNQSGNGWSPPRHLRSFAPIDQLASIHVVDLLGNGTACLVWSSPLPGEAHRPLRYIDLMSSRKPHLLTRVKNNIGGETRIHHAPSTKFYLLDRVAGSPWATQLPFPVQVVERVETLDWISRNRFSSRYFYHHGCFDSAERELRGFGMVEQHDTEELSALTQADVDFAATNLDSASHVPPVVTKTWYHPGIWDPGERVSHLFADEYWRSPGWTQAQAEALLLPDTILPPGLTLEEEREACRSLKGGILRQELFAHDGTARATIPYSVSERNYAVQLLQPRGQDAHAVFFTHARETIDYHYEREIDDPRVSHSLVLQVDPFGNVLRSANVAYGRRVFDPALTPADRAAQARTHATATESRFTNSVYTSDAHRTPLPCETRTFELTGPLFNGPERISFDEVLNAFATAVEIPYESAASSTTGQKRCLEHVRSYYRKNDLTAKLALGLIESLALPFETSQLAFTPALCTRLFGTKVTDLLLSGEGGYVHSEGDTNWWIPSGRIFFSSNPADSPPMERADAVAHFFLPRRFRNPFGAETLVRYDVHDLLTIEVEDSLQNRTTAGERDLLSGALLLNGNDYRVLQPTLVTDANGNRTAVVFDALGWAAGTAAMGQRNQLVPSGLPLGDSLTGFEPELTDAQLNAFFAQPRWQPGIPASLVTALLGGASSRMIYDPRRFFRFGGDPAHPTYAATLIRERHVSDLAAGEQSPIQTSVSFSDGFGREIQRKVQAEPGPMMDGGAVIQPRWVGSGWTIFNNKGKPVRQFEPFFTASVEFEFNRQHGVSPVIFYDPLGRSVATLNPDRSYAKVLFHPWRQSIWDANDTVLLNPRTDLDVRGLTAGYFAGLPPGWLTWQGIHSGGLLGAEEQAAATKAAAHAATPTTAHFDSLGRAFLTLADRGGGVLHASRAEFDLEGNERSIVDPRGRTIMRYDYDMLGRRMRQDSMEAGTRWTLLSIDAQPIRSWNSRGFVHAFSYDVLRRPTGILVTDPASPSPIQAERVIYGESLPNPLTTNHRGKPFQAFDGAGVVTSEVFDFKGNLLRASRRLVTNYKQRPDWTPSAPTPGLEPESYTTSTTTDALNRTITATTPDGTITRHIFNEANLLDRLEAKLTGDATPTVFIANLDYNARGQRVRLELGNGVVTTCTYDPATFRLRRLLTRRPRNPDVTRRVLQDLHYFYDPSGNVTRCRDDAQQPIFFNNSVALPHQDFTYDALYRLIEATGREHIGQAGISVVPEWDDPFRTNLVHPHDGNAMRPYTERYEYDEVGNFERMVHIAANGNWTRDYSYQSVSQLDPGEFNNRLTATEVTAPGVAYTHDIHGNMTSMPHLASLTWNSDDHLSSVSLGAGERAYYQYGASGQRLRKVRERANGTRLEERRYLGRWEVHRLYDGTGSGVTLERETLHVSAAALRTALVESRTRGAEPGVPARLTRYHIRNHLGSVAIEVADSNAAEVISHEEFYPYGASSYHATRSTVEAPNRYRFTGRERDDETGLNYHGSRYYARWLGRWISYDSRYLVDGTNLYRYCKNSPINYEDPNGTNGKGISEGSVLTGTVDPTLDKKGLAFNTETRVELTLRDGTVVHRRFDRFFVDKDGDFYALEAKGDTPENLTPNELRADREIQVHGARFKVVQSAGSPPPGHGQTREDIAFTKSFQGELKPGHTIYVDGSRNYQGTDDMPTTARVGAWKQAMEKVFSDAPGHEGLIRKTNPNAAPSWITPEQAAANYAAYVGAKKMDQIQRAKNWMSVKPSDHFLSTQRYHRSHTVEIAAGTVLAGAVVTSPVWGPRAVAAIPRAVQGAEKANRARVVVHEAVKELGGPAAVELEEKAYEYLEHEAEELPKKAMRYILEN